MPGNDPEIGLHGCLAGNLVDAPRLRQQIGATDDHLARDAPPVRALAADQLPLDPDDGEAGFGQPAGDLLATRSHADHHHVDLLFGLSHRDVLPDDLAFDS